MTHEMRIAPFTHQRERWELRRDTPNWGHFWEQGTGKSKVTIDTAWWMYAQGLINAIVVAAPGGVHTNWVKDELPKHMPETVEWRAMAWHASKAGNASHAREFRDLLSFPGLAILAISYDACAVTEKGKKALWDMLRKRKCLFVLDESARIKTPSAKRTQTLIKASVYAQARRILTGTPVANSPFDVYSQVRFLEPDFWRRTLGIASFSAFQSEFAVIQRFDTANGGKFDKVLSYKNLDTLSDALKLIADRVTKDEVLDLPPKLYQMRYFDMTPEQRRVYEGIRDECLAFLKGGDVVTAMMAVTRLLRLQQVTCGYVQPDDGPMRDIDGRNPRVETIREVVDDSQGRALIAWARFQRDIDLIADALKRDGRKVVTYDGRTSPDDRDRARKMFQDGTADVFLANPAAAGEGLTLTAADLVVYHNNSFRLTERLQSEDRAHRIGQTRSVTYIDLTCPGTIDEHVVKSLRNKMDVASAVTGDQLKEWLL